MESDSAARPALRDPSVGEATEEEPRTTFSPVARVAHSRLTASAAVIPSLPSSLFFVGPHEPSTLPPSIPHPTPALRKGTMIARGAPKIIRSLLDELRSLIT